MYVCMYVLYKQEKKLTYSSSDHFSPIVQWQSSRCGLHTIEDIDELTYRYLYSECPGSIPRIRTYMKLGTDRGNLRGFRALQLQVVVVVFIQDDKGFSIVLGL